MQVFHLLSIKVQHIACGDSFSIVAGTVRENSSTTAKFQCLARPIVLRDPNRIENLVTTALILHNMCVSERIMGNPRDRCNPANSLVRTKDGDLNVAEAVDAPEDREDVQSRHRSRSGAAKVGIENADEEVVELLTGRKRRWLELKDKDEAGRLHNAMMHHLVAKKNRKNRNKD